MKKIILLIGVGLLLTSNALAQLTIAFEDFEDFNGNEASWTAFADPVRLESVTGTRGFGLTSTIGSDAFSSKNFTSGSFDAADYLSFVITPKMEVEFQDFLFSLRRSSQGPDVWRMRSSFDGFTSDLDTGSIVPQNEKVNFSVNLGFSTAEEFELRLYAGGASNPNGTLRLDDFSLTAVPEPEQYALVVGLGLIAFAIVRRRRSV